MIVIRLLLFEKALIKGLLKALIKVLIKVLIKALEGPQSRLSKLPQLQFYILCCHDQIVMESFR